MALLLLIPMTGVASGTPISLTVDPVLVGSPAVGGYFSFDFSFGDQLNGIALSGQSISLDFVFADNILARVLGGAEGTLDFGVSLQIETSARSFPGVAGADTTGFVLAPGGDPLHAPLPVGRAASSTGWFTAGLFPGMRNFDMSGAHYDLTLPTTGHQIIGGRIRLTSNSENLSIRFGTPVQLPEGEVPSWFVASILATLMAARPFARPPGS